MSVYIIAEAGVNHNGSLEMAKKMVDKAVKAGVDCIKFQTFISENLVSKYANKAEYQMKNTDNHESQLEMLRKIELSFDDFSELNNYCIANQIQFLSTAFDFESIEFLAGIGINTWKIPSGEITNLPYLIKIAQLNQNVILSTGMCTIDEVQAAINVLKSNGCQEITLLHCTTEYPAPYAEVNLNAMLTLREEFKFPVGYSDHTQGIEISIAAVAMGATIIEKHFTLDKTAEGPDHKASLDPSELKMMVQAIRNVELAMGNGDKVPTESEIKNIAIARKSIVANCSIRKGELFTIENITTKRPGTGISPMRWFNVLGQTSGFDFEKDEMIRL